MASPATFSTYGQFIDLENYTGSPPETSGSIVLSGSAASERLFTNVGFTVTGSVISTAGFFGDVNNQVPLGSTSLSFSDLFLGDGGVINFNNGNATLTHSNALLTSNVEVRAAKLSIDSANDYIDVSTDLQVVAAADILLDPAGGDVKVDGNVVPNADDGGTLGSANLNWSDAYFADAAVINFGDDQEVTLTHVHNTGLLLSDDSGIGTTQLQFGDSGTYIHQAADGELDIVSDGNIDLAVGAAGVIIRGTNPKLTIGDAGAEDTFLVFDGNAQDYRIGLDDGTDKLEIGVGATHGTTTALTIDANQFVTATWLTASYAQIDKLDVNEINSIVRSETTLEVVDKLVVVASGSNSANTADAGLQFGGTSGSDTVASILYDHGNTGLDFNIAGSSEVLLTAAAMSPASSDGSALGTTSLMWSDLFLASGAVVNFNNGDITMTHSANLLDIAGGNTRVERLEIDSATDYIDLDGSANLEVVTARDIILNPGGNSVLPGSDSADDLGASGTAWANLFVDAIDLNGQGNISMGGTGRIDLDANDDTSIRASMDDVITFECGGADRISISTSAIGPSSDDGMALGMANFNWSDIYLADAAKAYFGDDQDVHLTHVHNRGLLLSGSGGLGQQLQFSDDGTYIYQSAPDNLDVVSDDAINLSATGSVNVTVGSAGMLIKGTTPKLTIGDAGAEDTFLVFDGNAQDYRIGLDDGTDKLEIGVGATHGTTTAMTIDANQQVAVVATTAASSTSTGALTVAGGASVAADLYVGDDLRLASDAALLTFGANDDVTLTHVHNTGLLLNSSMEMQFGDSDTKIAQSADGQLDIDADGTVEVTAPRTKIVSKNIDLGENDTDDVALAFLGSTNDGLITWDEGSDVFLVSDDVMLLNAEKMGFREATIYLQSSTSGQLDVVGPTIAMSGSTQVSATTPHFLVEDVISEKPVLEIKCNNPDANASTLKLHMTGATPADNDHLGTVLFQGGNDVGQAVEYARIRGISEDVSDGTEDGSIVFTAMIAGTARDVVTMGDGAGITLPNDSTYGTVKGHSFITYSDETLKTNIQPVQNALEKVKNLKGVTYDWKSDGTSDIGFIAQDVEKIIPQIVKSNGKEGSYGMNYSRVTALLVEGIKEQQAQIEKLKDALASINKK